VISHSEDPEGGSTLQVVKPPHCIHSEVWRVHEEVLLIPNREQLTQRFEDYKNGRESAKDWGGTAQMEIA